jgi:hypothetical protein
MIGIYFYIGDKKHTAPKSWQDVTFNKFLSYLDKVADKEPQVLQDFQNAHNRAVEKASDKLEGQELQDKAVRLFADRWEAMNWKDKKTCYDFFAIDVSFWCGVSAEQITTALDKDTLFNAFWALQVQMNPDNSEIDENYTGFAIKGAEYLLPKKHMEGSTVEEFADAAQFQENMTHLKGGNWRAMLDVMTVLCRPKGELYNDDEMFRQTRKNLFKTLPMTDVINVAFFLLRLNDTLKSNLAIYTAQQEIQRIKHSNLANGTDGLQ